MYVQASQGQAIGIYSIGDTRGEVDAVSGKQPFCRYRGKGLYINNLPYQIQKRLSGNRTARIPKLTYVLGHVYIKMCPANFLLSDAIPWEMSSRFVLSKRSPSPTCRSARVSKKL